jgi:hypothetical protein
LFCRKLAVLLGSDVALTPTLRILVDTMAATGRAAATTAVTLAISLIGPPKSPNSRHYGLNAARSRKCRTFFASRAVSTHHLPDVLNRMSSGVDD